MEVGLAVAEPLWDELRSALENNDETAGIILAGRAEEDGRLTLCLSRIIWVPETEYDERGPLELQIRSAGWMPALGQAARQGWQPIFFHTHPGNTAVASSHDLNVAIRLAAVFECRADTEYASLILGGTSEAPRFTGTVGDARVGGLRIVGKRLRLRTTADVEAEVKAPEVFDRQIRAFGRDGQELLRHLRVGIAGAGGTGSAVFEQLVRLGVGSIVTVDDDVITQTNTTRVYGSAMDDVGQPKVEVLVRHAQQIGLGSDVRPVPAKVTNREGFESLRGCDVVFGCTDDNGGRGILSRLAYYYCVLVFDVGVLITAHDREVKGLHERMTVMAPGTPCLFCRGRLDPKRIAEEKLAPEEREQLAAEGYAQGLVDPDPSIITYTTMIASFAVDEMLQRLFGFGDSEPASELLVRVPERQIRRLSGASRDGCFCGDPAKLGRADRDPPLDLSWT